MASSVRVNTKIKFNIKKIKGLKKALQEKMFTKVGIFGKKNTSDPDTGVTMAELGVIHNFGSAKKGIPPRPNLDMPIKNQKKQIQKEILAKKKFIEAAFVSGDTEVFYTFLGVTAVKAIDDAFRTGGFGKWAPNKPETVRRKKSSSPLIDKGQLRRSYGFEVKKVG